MIGGKKSLNNSFLIYIMLNHLRLFWKSVAFFHLDNLILIGFFFRMGKYKDKIVLTSVDMLIMFIQIEYLFSAIEFSFNV